MAAVQFLMGILCLGIVSRTCLYDSHDLKTFSVNEYRNHSFIIFKKQRYYEKTKNSAAIIEIARKEIGIREVTANSSPRIDQYNAAVGLKKVAWCASFLSWCFREAGLAQPRTAWSPALFPVQRLARDAIPGGIIGLYFPSMGRIAHCGLIERVQGSFVCTIEGNTNMAGSRAGDAVMRKLRHKRTIAKYADWL